MQCGGATEAEPALFVQLPCTPLASALKGCAPHTSWLTLPNSVPLCLSPHVQESPCGHFMHSHCFAAYTRYSYTCPVCFKSLGDMSVYWKMIDSLLAAGKYEASVWPCCDV